MLTVRIQNLPFTGGIVHVIDTFLVPPQNFIQTVPQFNLTAAGGAIENAYVDLLLLLMLSSWPGIKESCP